jgi:hypothetical protein
MQIMADDRMLADDILYGASAIAKFLFGDPGQRSRVYHLCAEGRLPHFRLGTSRRGRIYARRSSLRAWVEQQDKPAASEADNMKDRLAKTRSGSEGAS